MKYILDLRSLFFVLLCLLAIVSSFLVSLTWFTAVLTIPLCFLMFICWQINHNVMHLSIFKWEPLNILTNILLTISCGFPVTLLYYPHVANHHPHACNEKDWAGYLLVKNDFGIRRIIKYVFLANWAVTKERPRNIFYGLSAIRKLSLVLETLSLLIFVIFFLQFNPALFVVFYFLPSQIAMSILVFMNFFLHDGCDYHSENFNSKTFPNKVMNYLLFNNGYHQAHHFHPKLHWSKLPDFWHNQTHYPDKHRFEFESFFKHFKKLYLHPSPKNIH